MKVLYDFYMTRAARATKVACDKIVPSKLAGHLCKTDGPCASFFSHFNVSKLSISRTPLKDKQLVPVPMVSVLERELTVLHYIKSAGVDLCSSCSQ